MTANLEEICTRIVHLASTGMTDSPQCMNMQAGPLRDGVEVCEAQARETASTENSSDIRGVFPRVSDKISFDAPKGT